MRAVSIAEVYRAAAHRDAGAAERAVEALERYQRLAVTENESRATSSPRLHREAADALASVVHGLNGYLSEGITPLRTQPLSMWGLQLADSLY